MFKRVITEIDSFFSRDPAAKSRAEIVLCYPGFHALMAYRTSHWLWEKNWHLLARFISQLARWFTGIEIHPGARIGQRFFIDHGMGVVIGETAKIGDDVTIYQGVTLGGVSLHNDAVRNVRHPQIGNDVVIGAGAQVLGPLHVGDGARIGSNAVVVHDVKPQSTMVGIPARNVRDRAMAEVAKNEHDFDAYGMVHGDIPDPTMRAMERMSAQLERLANRVNELEEEKERAAAAAEGSKEKRSAKV